MKFRTLIAIIILAVIPRVAFASSSSTSPLSDVVDTGNTASTTVYLQEVEVIDDVTAGGNIDAATFTGDGSALTGITSATPTLTDVGTAGPTSTVSLQTDEDFVVGGYYLGSTNFAALANQTVAEGAATTSLILGQANSMFLGGFQPANGSFKSWGTLYDYSTDNYYLRFNSIEVMKFDTGATLLELKNTSDASVVQITNAGQVTSASGVIALSGDIVVNAGDIYAEDAYFNTLDIGSGADTLVVDNVGNLTTYGNIIATGTIFSTGTITSVLTLTAESGTSTVADLAVPGDIEIGGGFDTGSGITGKTTGELYAKEFIGDGSGLTGLSSSPFTRAGTIISPTTSGDTVSSNGGFYSEPSPPGATTAINIQGDFIMGSDAADDGYDVKWHGDVNNYLLDFDGQRTVLAVGTDNTYSGAQLYGSVMFGTGHNTQNHWTFAAGDTVDITGTAAMGIGSDIDIDAARIIALGKFIEGTTADTHIIGAGTGADASGMPNTTTNSLAIGYNSNEPSFVVGPSGGNGTTGKVGIGLAANDPGFSIDVALIVGDDSSTYGGIGFALSDEPSDPSTGTAVFWFDDGSTSTATGDMMFKINVGGVVKTTTLIDWSGL